MEACLRFVAGMILAALLAIAGAQAVRAQATVPSFNDARQRVAKPDTTSIARLRFLTTTDFFPFNFLDADRVLGGFHIDLARAICRELDLLDRCQIQALPFDELEEALVRGDGEALIAGLAITEESRSRLLFSRPYLKFPARFVVRREEPLEEPVHRAVPGRRIGVLQGTAHERMLRDFFPRAEAVTISESAELAEALREGRVDAIFGDGMRLGFWLAGEEGRACCAFAGGPYLAPEYLGQGLAIAVAPDQPLLVRAMDYALQEIDARGTFAELYLRYFPVSFY